MAYKTMAARYAGRCAKCRGVIDVGEQMDYDMASRRVFHPATTGCPAQPAVADVPLGATVPDLNLASIVAFLTAPRAAGVLQYPKARFAGPEGAVLKLTLAGAGVRDPRNIGSVSVLLELPSGAEQWLGRIAGPNDPAGLGTVGDPLAHSPGALALLERIAVDPAGAAKAYGALNNVCSFCDKELTDAGSVAAGYGPTCAKKWGLPHTARGTAIAKAVA